MRRLFLVNIVLAALAAGGIYIVRHGDKVTKQYVK